VQHVGLADGTLRCVGNHWHRRGESPAVWLADDGDEQIGIDSIRRATEEPVRQISGNAGFEGAIVLEKPRLLQVEGISCEATLDGNLMYSKNEDVPGVIGYLGTMLGKNGINIANFALGREDPAEPAGRKPGEPLIAISIVETDQPVPDSVIAQLFENKAVKYVRRVPLTGTRLHNH